MLFSLPVEVHHLVRSILYYSVLIWANEEQYLLLFIKMTIITVGIAQWVRCICLSYHMMTHFFFFLPTTYTDIGFPWSSGGWSCDHWWKSWPNTRPAMMFQTRASWSMLLCTAQRKQKLEPSKKIIFRLLA